MVQTYSMCTVWGEPLSQTAQSFMPELIYGVNRSLSKVSVSHLQCYKSYADVKRYFPCLNASFCCFHDIEQARLLLRSLVIIGVILGLLLGIVGTSVPWLFPYIFTPDRMVTQEVSSSCFQNLVYISVLSPLSFLILCNMFENLWQ